MSFMLYSTGQGLKAYVRETLGWADYDATADESIVIERTGKKYPTVFPGTPRVEEDS